MQLLAYFGIQKGKSQAVLQYPGNPRGKGIIKVRDRSGTIDTREGEEWNIGVYYNHSRPPDEKGAQPDLPNESQDGPHDEQESKQEEGRQAKGTQNPVTGGRTPSSLEPTLADTPPAS